MIRHLRFPAAIVIAGLSLTACHKAVESVDTSGPMVVRTEAVRLDTLRVSLTITGTVAPAPGADWTIIAPQDGTVAEMPKAEGEIVNEGDLLVRFDVPAIRAEVTARQADVLQTNTRLKAARANDAKFASLLERGIVTQRDADDARKALSEAETAANEAMSAKQAADVLSSHAVITARFAGVVAHRWHNVGDQVTAASTDPVLQVIDPTRLEIVGPVPIAQLPLINAGRPVRIFNPTDGGVLDSTVITTPPAVDATATSADVRVAIPKTAPFTAGMPVQFEILGDERVNVLVVSTAAILRDGSDTYVMVAGTDGKAHQKSVVVGLVAQQRAQIQSGLTAGENVILAGPEPIADGASITMQK